MVGRAGLIRPLASPFGPAQALSKIDGAILSNLNAGYSPTRSVRYAMPGFGESAEVSERMVGRAGLIRPLASPFGPAQALPKIDGAILSNLNAGYSPTRFVRYVILCFGESAEVSERMVGRAGFEPATN